ncbi:MAG: cystathionine beta-lyase [Hirschia sp.]|nr:cystathionine beta-lyase [Hirschia sp.]MBF17221.1 cystathionine beta-lyase [Hirschia sp.]
MKSKALETRLTHTGRPDGAPSHAINLAPQRASTLLVNKAEDLYAPGIKTYGLQGMDVHDAAKAALCTLEKADHCILVESGLLACTLPIFTFVGAGDHVLLPGNVYGPTRRYCERSLKRLGGQVSYYNADIGADIEGLIQDNTKLIILESPGSLTFEMPDIRAIVEVARKREVLTALDNSWSAGVYLNPLDLGVDMSILATTKYAVGHADSFSGAILVKDKRIFSKLTEASADLGLFTSADDAYLLLRGLRTLTVRMQRHQQSALDIARWLNELPEVEQVFHPALETDAYHQLWKRDFTGASGLFAFSINAADDGTDLAFLNALELFGLGFSYGGFESLAINCGPQLKRSATTPPSNKPIIRLAIGLEDPEDLKQDLAQAFTSALRT